MLNQYHGTSFFVIMMLRLVLKLVYLHHIIDASSAFIVVYSPPTTFCRLLPLQRKLRTARRRSGITAPFTTDPLGTVLASSSPQFSPSSEPASKHQHQEVELWLDLRGTKVTPHVALTYIMQELRDDSFTEDENASRSTIMLASKVLVSSNDGTGNNSTKEKQQRHESNKALRDEIAHEIEDEEEIQIEILFTSVDKDRNSVNLCCRRRSEKDECENVITIGEVMNIPTGASSSYIGDPIQALEVVSRGEWLFLDDHSSNIKMMKASSQDERIEAVQSLVELVSSGGCASLSSFSLGGVDENDVIEDGRLNFDGASARLSGIAIGCRTNADILQIAGCIRSLVTTGGDEGYTTTESGIYIQASSDDKDEYDTSKDGDKINPSSSSTTISMPDEDTEKGSMIRYAIVMPFETALWKSAALLFR